MVAIERTVQTRPSRAVSPSGPSESLRRWLAMAGDGACRGGGPPCSSARRGLPERAARAGARPARGPRARPHSLALACTISIPPPLSRARAHARTHARRLVLMVTRDRLRPRPGQIARTGSARLSGGNHIADEAAAIAPARPLEPLRLPQILAQVRSSPRRRSEARPGPSTRCTRVPGRLGP